MHASNILTPCRDFCYLQPVQVLPCLLNLSLIGIGKGFTLAIHTPTSSQLQTRSYPQKARSAPVFSIRTSYTTASSIQRILESLLTFLAVHSTRITTYIWTTQRHSRIPPATTRSRFQYQLSPSGYLHTFGLEAKGTRKLI